MDESTNCRIQIPMTDMAMCCESTLTDLMKAVKACSVPQVKEVMHQAGRFSTAGYTALAYAAVLNYADLAALLIEKEAGL